MSAAGLDVGDGGPSLHLRRAEAETWLDVAFGDRAGWVALAFGIGPYRTAQGRYAHWPWREDCYRWPEQRSALLNDVAGRLADADAAGPLVDVYVCPHLRSSDARHGPSHATGGNALPPTALHVDLDGQPGDTALWDRLDPLVVESGSPGHAHGLVVLAEPLADLDRWAQLQRALRDGLGGGADAKIAHNDVLRLPGTVNAKPSAPVSGPPGPPVPVTLSGWSGRLWALPDLADVLGVDLSEPAPARPGRAGPLAVPTSVPVPTNLALRVQAVVDGFATSRDRSAEWARLIGRAGSAGYSRDQAFALAVAHALPHLPRYSGREVVEFDRAWSKWAAWMETREVDSISRADVRRMVEEEGGDVGAVRARLATDVDPHLWSRLQLDDVFGPAAGPAAPAVVGPPEDESRSSGPALDRSPRALLTDLLADLGGWLLLPDLVPLLAGLAVAVTAEEGEGDPAWLLFVASPSSGKTEVIRLFDAVATERLDDVTVGGLLTWSKGGKVPVPVGVLTRVRRGLLTFGDLSTLLAGSDQGTRDEVFALLRRVADGELKRDVAPASRAAVPGSLRWHGRVQVIAGVTGVIDRYANHNAALGDRWLSCRLVPLTREQGRRASRMCGVRDLPGHRDQASKRVADLVEVARAGLDTESDLPDVLADVIDDAAQVTAWGRASVPRSSHGRREIEDVPTIEEPMRLVRQLGVVARGVLALGLSADDAATVCRRLAVDSMPEARRGVLRALAEAGEPVTTAAVARAAGLHHNVAARRLEELATVGVVVPLTLGGDGSDAPDVVGAGADGAPDGRVSTRWRLADDAVDLVRDVMTGLTCVDMSHENGGP